MPSLRLFQSRWQRCSVELRPTILHFIIQNETKMKRNETNKTKRTTGEDTYGFRFRSILFSFRYCSLRFVFALLRSIENTAGRNHSNSNAKGKSRNYPTCKRRSTKSKKHSKMFRQLQNIPKCGKCPKYSKQLKISVIAGVRRFSDQIDRIDAN